MVINVCNNTAANFLATGQGSFLSIWASWQGVVATAVLVVFLVAGLIYMLAGLMQHRGLRVWAQNQVYEGFATLVIAFFIVGIVSWICGVDVSIIGATCTPSGSCNMFDVADYYLTDFSNTIWTAWWGIFIANMTIGAISTYTYSPGASGLGIVITFGAGLSQLSSSFSSALVMVTIAQVLTKAQILLIRIAGALFGYLLPAGIVLRAFGITRGFGGALIAIAIGFYLIYPLAVVFSYGLVLNNIHNQVNSMPSGGSMDVASWQSSAGGFFGSVCGIVGTVLVGAVLIPFIAFVVVVAFTKGLSSAIGEEVDVSNLTRLI